MSALPAPELLTSREFARRAGCDEKQVRRALESGKLARDASGKIDAALIDSAWRKPRRDSREKPAAKPADSADTAAADKTMSAPRTDAGADAPAVGAAGSSLLKDAVTRKEDFAGRIKELDYRQRAGELIELEVARRVLFEEHRAARDAWLNWPAKHAALIAADLGIEADRVAEVLTAYVHKQLAALGEPSGEFVQG